MGRFPSGQREQTVNLPSVTSMVRIHPCPPTSYAGMAELADALDSGSSVRLGHAGSSPVSRTKALKTTSFQGFFLSLQGSFPSMLRARFCARFLEENLVGRIRMKQVEGLGNVIDATMMKPGRMPRLQTTDKARNCKNADRKNEIGWHFCLLRQQRLQISVTYACVCAFICSLASLSCRLSQRLSKC